MKLPTDAMEGLLGGVKEKLDAQMQESARMVQAEMEEIRENQNQQMLALASIYDLLKQVALCQGMKESDLPKPKISMNIEEADK